MMGTVHVIIALLAAIAARFKDAGLHDIVTQSLIVAKSLVDTTFPDLLHVTTVRIYKTL